MTDCGILVLDDQILIAMDVEMTLQAAGFASVTVCSSVAAAQDAIETSRPVLAILDLNLGNGETSLPVAKRLRALGCPFLFLSGYTAATVTLPEELADAPRLTKPFRGEALVTEVRNMLAGT